MKHEEYIPATSDSHLFVLPNILHVETLARENKRKTNGHGSKFGTGCEWQNPFLFVCLFVEDLCILVTSVCRVHMVQMDIPIFFQTPRFKGHLLMEE